MKKHILQLVLAILIVVPILTFAQDPTYEARLVNDALVAPNQYEFDIYVKRTGTTAFETYGIQVALIMDDAVRNGGTLNGIYVVGTSGMVTAQIPNNPNNAAAFTLVGTKRVFKLAAKIPSGPGSGTVLSSSGNGTRLGRFRIQTTATNFLPQPLNLAWNFDQATYGYATKIQAYVDDGAGPLPKDVTVPGSSLNELLNWPLPVELSSFKASTQGREVQLNWETRTEVNTSLFQLERVTDKTENWVKVGEVAASGNSNSVKEYSFTDKKLNSGKYSYRLKMLNNDGTYQYSKEVEAEVSLPKEYAISQNYPNPFNPTTRIDYQLPFDSKVNIELYGITGEKVGTILNGEMAAGYYTADINASAMNLASGVYIYRMTANNPSGQNFVQVKKLMLTK